MSEHCTPAVRVALPSAPQSLTDCTGVCYNHPNSLHCIYTMCAVYSTN